MRSPSRVTRTVLTVSPFLAITLLPALARAATLTYPGPAPCNTTLQKCIDGAKSGDRIEIGTAAPILEHLTIKTSLTLTGAPNVVPTIGDPNANTYTIDVDLIATTATEVALRGLKLAGHGVNFASSGSGTGHRFAVTDCELNDGGIVVDVRTPNSKIELVHNFVAARANNGSLSIWTSDAGNGTFTIAGNRITTAMPTVSSIGLDLRAEGAGTHRFDVASNVIYGTGGCNCGTPAGINVSTYDNADSTVNITGNTLADNANGRAILVRNVPATAKLKANVFNNVLYGSGNSNRVGFPPLSANVTIANGYNDQYPAAVNDVGGYPWAASNVAVDPKFVNAANRNYRLNVTSPVVDAGYGSASGSSDLDADDHVRVAGGAVDIGAYEVGSSAAADLTLTGKSEPSAVAQGGQVTYALHVVNSGPSPALGAAITLPLPVGAALVSAASTHGSCTGASPVRCELGTLRKDEAVDVDVVVTLAQAGTLQATATASSGTPDPKSADNLVTLSVDVTAPVADAGADVPGDDRPGNDDAGPGDADRSGGPDAPDTPAPPESVDSGCAMGGSAGLRPLWLFAALGLAAALRRRRA